MMNRIGFLIVAILLQQTAQAGVVNGGGGVALVCRGPDHNIQSAELLDLAEAKYRGLELVAEKSLVGNYRILMSRWIVAHHARPAVESDEVLLGYVRDIFSRFLFTESKKALPESDDYKTNLSIPVGCALEQLAFFDDNTFKIHVQREIWAALDDQNKIALIGHEMIYQNTRLIHGNRTSDCARILTGEFLSTTPPQDLAPERTRCGL